MEFKVFQKELTLGAMHDPIHHYSLTKIPIRNDKL